MNGKSGFEFRCSFLGCHRSDREAARGPTHAANHAALATKVEIIDTLTKIMHRNQTLG
jgi:hypothetical protein